ncbi:MAG: multidrug efflux MFS transporter PmrA [Candidatus Promineifilaceae bacterium]
MNTPTTAAKSRQIVSTPALIGLALVTRILTDTGVQLFFPFLPIIAAGLGITTVTLGQLVSARSSTGLLSPVFGTLADKYGYRRIMRLGLFMAAVGYLLIALNIHLWLTGAGMLLAGMGTFSFVPNLQAYLSTRLPYQQRARGLAIPEYGWALSGIMGLWLMGELIEATSWQMPFYVVAAFCLLFYVIFGLLPPGSRPQPAKVKQQIPAKKVFFDLGVNWRSAWATLAVSMLAMFAGMGLFINYGSWLVDNFALGPAALGRVALILGAADLVGSGLVSVIGDKFGKRRLVVAGAVLGVAAFGLLPLWSVSLVTAVAAIVLARFAFEVAVVANIALISEQSPAQRGKLLTLGAAFALFGSTTASLIGPAIYTQRGIGTMTSLSAGAFLIALVLIWRFVREPEGSGEAVG